MARTKKAATKKSLKIKSKRERAKGRKTKRTRKSGLRIKIVKLARTTKKARALAKKCLKTALKGVDVKHLPAKLYKHIDTAISKNEALSAAIEAAVVAAVNEITAKTATTEAPAKRGRKKKEAPAETAA